MSVEKKSLINNMSATKKAIIASSPKTVTPVVSNKLAGKKFLGKKVAGKLAAKVAAKRAGKFVY